MLSVLGRCYAYGYAAGLGRDLTEQELQDCDTLVAEAYTKILQERKI
jgi:hypothetical protein